MDNTRKISIQSIKIPSIEPTANENTSGIKVSSVAIRPVQPVESEALQKLMVPLSGKLITADDPMTIGQNFRTLVNMRYKDKAIASIGGMTKINSSVMDDTYLKTRNAYHFKKVQPADTPVTENHILVQAYNTGLTASKVLQNIGIPPAETTFEAEEIWTDSEDADMGFFSEAPNGNIAYCNGVDSCLWGGNGIPVSAFITSTAAVTTTVTNPKDYTGSVSNNKQDSDNIAIIGFGIDSYTKLMIHANEADGTAGTSILDSSPTPKTITAVGDAQVDTEQAKFGTGSIMLDGTGDYLSLVDSTDWYFDSDFTIDLWVRPTALTTSRIICAQRVDGNNYWMFYITGVGYAIFAGRVSGSMVISAQSSITVSANTWSHIAVARSGINYYVFVNGILSSPAASVTALPDLASPLYIGYAGGEALGNWYGYIDEFRISKGIARWTTTFSPPTRPYTVPSNYCLVGTPRPIKGIKFFISNGNTLSSTLTVSTWNGYSWQPLSVTDGTDSGGVSMAETGSVTFDSTVDISKIRYLEGRLIYWYQISLDAGGADIYHVTVDAPFQQIIDLWDGVWRDISKFYLYKSTYEDYTINLYSDMYDSGDATTYLQLQGLTSSNYVEIGFNERMTAIGFSLPAGLVNATADTSATVYYWNGSEYMTVGTIVDGTSIGSISMSAPGIISWSSPGASVEQKKAINNGTPYYYYKIVWNKTLSGATSSVILSYVYGIPAQNAIRGYKFPLFGQDRLLLCNNIDEERNSILYTAFGTSQIINGTDSGKIYLGDNTDLICGCNIFSQYAQSLYSITLIFKEREIWSLVYDEKGWHQYRTTDTIGCNAPKTLKTVVIPPVAGDNSGNRNLAIWMNSGGVYISDGRHPILVSYDIRDMFDQTSARHVNLSYIQNAAAWVDQERLEYHIVFATTTGAVTTNDTEWVLDIKRWRWFEVNRTQAGGFSIGFPDIALQCGISVSDTYGGSYNYGFIDTGYMERLEYGNTFDGNYITSIFQLGDFPLIEGDFMSETSIRKLIQFGVSKGKTLLTSGTLTFGKKYRIITYVFGDDFINVGAVSNASGVEFTASGSYPSVWTNGSSLAEVCYADMVHYIDASGSGTNYTANFVLPDYRIVFPINNANTTPGVLHSLRGTVSTNVETVGYEPIGIGILYQKVRDLLV